MPFSGLEVGLLDVGRFVALSGYAPACRRLAFVARGFYGEDDYLVAGKLLTYGQKRRTRLMSLARKGDLPRVTLLLKVGADVNAADTDGLTSLLLASERGHASVVRALLGKGANIDAEDARGRTALHHASRGGHVDVVRLLLSTGKFDVNAADEDGQTPLHLASERGRTSVVEALLDLNADINAADSKGDDWDLEAEGSLTALLHAAKNGHRDIVSLLVTAGADVNEKGRDFMGRTSVDWALERRDTPLLSLLGDLGASYESSSWRVYFIENLTDACDKGDLELVRALVKVGVDVNGCSPGYFVPLNFSEDAGHHEITAFLAEAGADMDCDVLPSAVDKDDAASVRRLVGLGASPSTGLSIACWEGNEAMVRLLLDLGADANAKNEDGDAAIHTAEKQGHHAITRLLRDKGADLEAPGYAGKTVLACAIEKGDAASVRRLVALGASPSSGLSVARGAGHAAMVKLLLELGGGEGAAAGAAVGAGAGAVDGEKG
jgi:ankyrin repeat protein